jgi:hypothetical protein
MRPSLRYLRITWTAICGIACILLCVLWVRSYQFIDVSGISRHALVSMSGKLFVVESIEFYVQMDLSAPNVALRNHFWGSSLPISGVSLELVGKSLTVPYWSTVAVMCLISAVPWLPWRFSLRTLLIAITLVALVLGIIVWLVR